MKDNYCNFGAFYNKFNIEYLDLYEILKGKIENSDNNKEFYDVMNFSISLLKDGHTNLAELSNIDNVEAKIINKDIAYLKINSFMKFTNEDAEKIKKLYKDIDNYNNFIIDIRGNGGDGIGVDPILSSLPNSGLVIRLTCKSPVNILFTGFHFKISKT
ncbi:S41 family peptidase [Romboutsia sedimentorum]|uniref:S41 family peptidase n=1 Tax=Romboutsia sedimentorum TaxID=1368474 RepID=A0ABT7E622_9FIRM|nr:S41 family peptidase [Romboutsia sedimentorum]MDK2562380.1 S41 family peptidase [Romboutsia sedimentorum]